MTWWLWVLAGALVYVPCWRATLRSMLKEDFDEGTFGELVFCMVAAVVFAPVGLFLIVQNTGMLDRDVRTLGRRIAGESRADKRKRRARELREREQRIRDAERELGIGER